MNILRSNQINPTMFSNPDWITSGHVLRVCVFMCVHMCVHTHACWVYRSVYPGSFPQRSPFSHPEKQPFILGASPRGATQAGLSIIRH